ncbi:MAG: GGDEF domain-containing protein [Clostridia bacterium]|nr:GGDEF domain-containing protein [Clostridia bacterium]
MFNDKKHLNRSFCVSIFFLILYILRSTAETYTTIESIINYISFFGIIVIAYLFGLISINFFDFNFYIIENQSITNDRLRKKIKTDALTGLYNRDTMHIETGRSIEIYKEVGIPFCLAIIDIDNFKMINDTYGHNNGDIVLKKISNVLKHTCNENDCVCRFGGDEFAIIFNNKSAEDVKAVTYSIMTDISNLAYSFTNIKITCSCGIAEYNGNMSSSELFNIADRNMYQAKNNGKNQIYC